jgi:hypothetical protein
MAMPHCLSVPSAASPGLDLQTVAAFERRYPAFWEPHPLPTTESIAKISAHFDISLPTQLIRLAQATSHFSSIFLSLGPDEDAPNHIIPYNRYWRRRRRTRRLPATHIILSNGFMDEDFWCLVRPANELRSEGSKGDDMVIQYWSPAPIGFPGQMTYGEAYRGFPAFLSMLCNSD